MGKTGTEDSRVVCRLCDQPMEPLELGPTKFQVHVHRGEHLDLCQAIRLPYNYLLPLFKQVRELKKKFSLKFDEEGNVKPHGTQ